MSVTATDVQSASSTDVQSASSTDVRPRAGGVKPYRLHRMVLTVCGRCLSRSPDMALEYERDILQGDLVEQDGRLLLRRHCRRGHGEVVSLYEEDALLWESLQGWRVPTKWHEPDTEEDAPAPLGYLGGLGRSQEQHTCTLLVDVTRDCNLACPTCFAGCAPGDDRYARPADVLRSLDTVLEREGGRLDLVMLSGGEPTLHPQLGPLLDAILERDVTRVVVNTNGLVLAHDDALLGLLADRRRRVEVYLQYDGPTSAAYRALRGSDLASVKERAISRLSAAKVFTTFACTVALGVNDEAVGAVADLALGTDHCGGVVFQPMFGVPVADPLSRVTATGVLRRLEEQTEGRLRREDFLPIPCSHPDCATVNYLVRADHGTWRSVTELLGRERIREHLALVGNRLVPDDETWDAFLGLYSGSTSVAREDMLDHLATLTGACRLDLGNFARLLGRSILGRRMSIDDVAARVRRFSVKGFMDQWTLNVERLRQCCVHVGSVDPEAPVTRVPFCARNVFADLRANSNRGLVPADEVQAPRTSP